MKNDIQPQTTVQEKPITVFVISWGRPIYLWACLDALYKNTRSAMKVVLFDNAHPDPLVSRVIEGFERRGLFDEVVRFKTNTSDNIVKAYEERLVDAGPLHVYLESDCVILCESGCWLAEMKSVMDSQPKLAMLGSLIDPTDFVSEDKAIALTGGDKESSNFLSKLHSPERAFIQDSPMEDEALGYIPIGKDSAISNPPGRLMMLRTSLMQQVGLKLDVKLARYFTEQGFSTGISAKVRHRHLSLMNIYDYWDYSADQRTAFFSGLNS